MLKRIACALLAAGMLAGAAGAEPLLESWDKVAKIEGGEGRYIVWDGDLWGVARADGETIIEPMFQNEPEFVGDLTAAAIRGGAFTGVSEAVEYSRLYGAVNRAGEIVIPIEYGDLALSDDGRIATVELDGRYGFIDAQGNEILPPTYDGAGPFVDGYAAVMRSEPLPPDADVSETGRRSYGAVDESGREVIACGYEYLEIHPGPLAIVQVGDLYGAIDMAENFIIPPEYQYIYAEGQGMLIARTRVRRSESGMDDSETSIFSYGAFDAQGEIAIPFEYDDLRIGDEGPAIAEIDGAYGLVSLDGEALTDFAYSEIGPFTGGIAYCFIRGEGVYSKSLVGVIDENGRQLLACEWDNIQNTPDGYRAFRGEEKHSFAMQGGELIEIDGAEAAD